MVTDHALAPCRRDTPALSAAECRSRLTTLPAWQLVQVDGIPQLERRYPFRTFAEALAFGNVVGALAEAADHHPALTVEWGQLTLRWWTHVIGGLHANDFVMAARCEAAYAAQAGAAP
jgi:4a-hydroxytetrahydrobiopterin dehydratase